MTFWSQMCPLGEILNSNLGIKYRFILDVNKLIILFKLLFEVKIHIGLTDNWAFCPMVYSNHEKTNHESPPSTNIVYSISNCMCPSPPCKVTYSLSTVKRTVKHLTKIMLRCCTRENVVGAPPLFHCNHAFILMKWVRFCFLRLQSNKQTVPELPNKSYHYFIFPQLTSHRNDQICPALDLFALIVTSTGWAVSKFGHQCHFSCFNWEQMVTLTALEPSANCLQVDLPGLTEQSCLFLYHWFIQLQHFISQM